MPWGAVLAFVAHYRVEGEVSLHLDVLGRTFGGREGENKVVVGLRSGMKQVARVFIARLRERAHCSLL